MLCRSSLSCCLMFVLELSASYSTSSGWYWRLCAAETWLPHNVKHLSSSSSTSQLLLCCLPPLHFVPPPSPSPVHICWGDRTTLKMWQVDKCLTMKVDLKQNKNNDKGKSHLFDEIIYGNNNLFCCFVLHKNVIQFLKPKLYGSSGRTLAKHRRRRATAVPILSFR